MLTRDEFEFFAEREKEQGWHLRGALLDRYQKTFSEPKPEIRRLRAKKRSLLNASNAYARVRWMRALGGYVCEHLGAEAPHWEPDQPVYFLTIIDKEQLHHLNPVYFENRSFSSSGSSLSLTQSRSATAQGVWFRRASKASPRRIRSSALAWQ